MIEAFLEYSPVKIGVCALMEDGRSLTCYFGDCDQQDKAVMAHQIYSDSIMDMILHNAGMILEAADDDCDENGG